MVLRVILAEPSWHRLCDTAAVEIHRMSGTPAKHAAPKARAIINWEFARGQERMSCRIDRGSDTAGVFAVALVPYRHLQRATVETFEAAAAAFGRHATLATDLRNSGWKLVGYTS